MRYGLFIIALLMLTGCQTPGQRWLNNLAEFREVRSADLSLQALKIKSADTSELSYKLRVYPSKAWLSAHTSNAAAGQFFYGMDSAFTIIAGSRQLQPQLVQPVANGLLNCFEYLITIDLDKQVKMKTLSIGYKDRFIDGKSYSINL